MTKVADSPNSSIINLTCDKIKRFAIETVHQFQLIYGLGQVKTVKYSLLDVEPRFVISSFCASTLNSAKLVQVGSTKLGWKEYELKISGEDDTHRLPDQTARGFKITFRFRSVYSRKNLCEFLTGVTKFGFVNGLREEWTAVAVTKGQDNTLLLKRTCPQGWESEYQKMNLFDFNSNPLKNSTTVEIPGGLYVQ